MLLSFFSPRVGTLVEELVRDRGGVAGGVLVSLETILRLFISFQDSIERYAGVLNEWRNQRKLCAVENQAVVAMNGRCRRTGSRWISGSLGEDGEAVTVMCACNHAQN